MTLPTLAANLARALRLMPCTCVTTGSWPRFKDVKAHPERTCSRCAALSEYDAYQAIVQTPEVAARQVQDSLKEAGK
jgi:hypothetical protein